MQLGVTELLHGLRLGGFDCDVEILGLSEHAKTVIVYATFPDVDQARTVAENLVGTQLAACVHMIGGMQSVYRWQGAVERGSEVVVIVKTRAALATRVIERIEEMHPYDTPGAVVLDIVAGSARYLEWLCAQTLSIDEAD